MVSLLGLVRFPVLFGEELSVMLLKEEGVVELGRQVGVTGG